MVPVELRKKFAKYLSPFITDHKKELVEEILKSRTRFITIAIEDIYQSHNASAVIRTCDCLSIQDIHIIENKNQYDLNKDVVLGSAQWVNVIQYNNEPNNSVQCINHLKSKGYQIIGTSLNEDAKPLPGFTFNSPIALLFGTELDGLSEDAISGCDQLIKIPMYGFTESYNISVSASIILYHLVQKIYHSNLKWGLSEEEKDELRINWYKNIVKHPDKLEADFIRKNI